MSAFFVASLLLASIPRPAQYFDNLVDHFSAAGATYQQRFYEIDEHFKGPGSPVVCIMGGEGGVPPSTGIFYPWVATVVAARLGALVIQPEHRFYGSSLPAGLPPFNASQLTLLSPPQALMDALALIQSQQKLRGCTGRGTAGYCPVVTIGGSYPGFLSAMMRLRYPAVVDIAYAASAPLAYYAQQVPWPAYYELITMSAERSYKGCAAALRIAFKSLATGSFAELVHELGLCEDLPAYISRGGVDLLRDEVAMVLQYTFAGLNMGNYPPSNATALHGACAAVVARPSLATLGLLLRQYASTAVRGGGGRRPTSLTVAALEGGGASGYGVQGASGYRVQGASKSVRCFEMASQLPAGVNATISSADWSGVGVGSDGESWDYQTCTMLVEAIGTNNVTDAFPPRPWSSTWLEAHCRARFGVAPRPTELADAWGFAPERLVGAGASRIIFTNGLNDGWSVGSVTSSPSSSLIALNMPNGAHHSDLSHEAPSPADTPDVVAVRAKGLALIQHWLANLPRHVESV